MCLYKRLGCWLWRLKNKIYYFLYRLLFYYYYYLLLLCIFFIIQNQIIINKSQPHLNPSNTHLPHKPNNPPSRHATPAFLHPPSFLQTSGTDPLDMEATITTPSGQSELCEIRGMGDSLCSLKFKPKEDGVNNISLKYKGLHFAGEGRLG